MNELRNTTKLVKQVLETVPAARSSDNVLYVEVVKTINKSLIFKPLAEVLTNTKKYALPSPETVGRCRRKLQAEFPELRATQRIEDFREERMEEFRDWAGEQHDR